MLSSSAVAAGTDRVPRATVPSSRSISEAAPLRLLERAYCKRPVLLSKGRLFHSTLPHVSPLDHRRLDLERFEVGPTVGPEPLLIEAHARVADLHEAIDDVHTVDDLAEHREVVLRIGEAVVLDEV